MGEASDQITTRIDQTREDLRLNLEELENRVKAVTDLRGQIRKHPAALVIAVVAGGLLLSALLGKR